MEDIVAIVLIFGTGGAFLLSISPIGRAIAARIKGEGRADREEMADLQDAVSELMEENRVMRDELTEVQERMDFAERALSAGPESGDGSPGQ